MFKAQICFLIHFLISQVKIQFPNFDFFVKIDELRFQTLLVNAITLPITFQTSVAKILKYFLEI
jgi:hypothetical protein